MIYKTGAGFMNARKMLWVSVVKKSTDVDGLGAVAFILARTV